MNLFTSLSKNFLRFRIQDDDSPFIPWKDLLKIDPDNLQILGIKLVAGDFKSLVKTALTVAISLLIVLLIGVIGYGGLLWITAGDREEQLQNSKKIIKNGFFGVIIAFGFLAMLGIISAIIGINITSFAFLDDIISE